MGRMACSLVLKPFYRPMEEAYALYKPEPNRTLSDSSAYESRTNITEIARILGRHKSTMIIELSLGSRRRGYRPRQAHNLSYERSQFSRNSYHIDEEIKAAH